CLPKPAVSFLSESTDCEPFGTLTKTQPARFPSRPTPSGWSENPTEVEDQSPETGSWTTRVSISKARFEAVLESAIPGGGPETIVPVPYTASGAVRATPRRHK